MVLSKDLKIRLYFNNANKTHYVQIGDQCLFEVKATVAHKIFEKEHIQIVSALDVDHIKDLSIQKED